MTYAPDDSPCRSPPKRKPSLQSLFEIEYTAVLVGFASEGWMYRHSLPVNIRLEQRAQRVMKLTVFGSKLIAKI
jgi:hypothetical protein